jgi:hypothetical protein
MKKFTKTCLSALIFTFAISAPAFAKGEINVEHSDGIIDSYSDVTISNTADILYFEDPDTGTILMISKKGCNPEGELLLCQEARMGVDTHGVMEELGVKQIFLFINPTQKAQPIKNSEVTLSPGTVLLEASTNKGSYITGLGKIDATTKPAGASR